MPLEDLTLDWRTRGRRWRQFQTIKLFERERGRELKPNQRRKQTNKQKDLPLKMNAQAEFQNCFRLLIFKKQVNKIAHKT